MADPVIEGGTYLEGVIRSRKNRSQNQEKISASSASTCRVQIRIFRHQCFKCLSVEVQILFFV